VHVLDDVERSSIAFEEHQNGGSFIINLNQETKHETPSYGNPHARCDWLIRPSADSRRPPVTSSGRGHTADPTGAAY
jgi:hypothetical protein